MKRCVLRMMCVLGVAGVAGAETVTLPDVVVTPMRDARETVLVPQSAYTVGRDDLASDSPRTTPDALKGLPSVMVQKTSYGQGSPFLRGFTGFRTLMMVDGIRLNNSVFRDGPNQYWNTIDPFSIDRYEVVLGPASVLYGSDAIGGAVNAISAESPAWTGAPTWERTLEYRGATADESSQARAEFGGRPTESLGFRAGYSWKTFDDVEGGEDVGTQEHTGYDEQAWDARVDYITRGDTKLTLGHQTVDQDDAWRTHRTIYGIDWEGLKKGDDKVHSFDQGRDLTWLRIAAEDLATAVDGYSLTLSLQSQDEDLNRVRANDRNDLQGFDVDTYGAALTLESDAPVGNLVYGVDYYRDLVDSYSIRIDPGKAPKRATQGPVADDATYDVVGAFVQDTLTLAGGRIELTPGVRYTYASVDADKVDQNPDGISDSWDAVVGSLRAVMLLDEERRQSVFAGVSQGFRAPNLSDLTRLDTARSNEIETPVDNLDPERFITAEFGWRPRGDVWRAELVYYHTWIDDLIVRAPTGETVDELLEVTKKNASEGFVQGIEFTGELDLTPDWRLRAMGAWMDGEADAYPTSDPVEVRDDLSRVMPLTGQLALRWKPVGAKYWVEGVVDAADDADKLSADDARDTQRIPPGGTPGFTVFTLRGGMQVTKAWNVTVAAENMTDEDYRIHGSGVNEPGRQLVLTTGVTW